MLNAFIVPMMRNVMSWIRSAGELLAAQTKQESHLAVAKLYRIVLLSWFFLHTAILLPYAGQIFSPDAYMATRPMTSSWLGWVTEVLLHPAVAPYYALFITAQLVLLALAIGGYRLRLTIPLVWAVTLNLNAKAGVIMDGGNNLSELLLFYMMLMNTSGRPVGLDAWPRLRSLVVGFANGAFFLSRFQVFVVYLTVGLFKLNGHLWQSGMALYYILQAREYTHPVLGRFLVDHEWLAMASTYYTLLFQASFPYLVWGRKTRPVLLLMGTSLHLGIAFVMGLFTFGLVMCASYFLFFRESWSVAVLAGPSRLLRARARAAHQGPQAAIA